MEQHKFEIEAKRMRPAILRMATHYTEDTDEAEDVVQEVLLKLWFLRERLSQYRNIDALAMVITKHLCINRKRGEHLDIVPLEEGWMIEGEASPEKRLVDDERMRELLELIANLPDLQQAILRMKHINTRIVLWTTNASNNCATFLNWYKDRIFSRQKPIFGRNL